MPFIFPILPILSIAQDGKDRKDGMKEIVLLSSCLSCREAILPILFVLKKGETWVVFLNPALSSEEEEHCNGDAEHHDEDDRISPMKAEFWHIIEIHSIDAADECEGNKNC